MTRLKIAISEKSKHQNLLSRCDIIFSFTKNQSSSPHVHWNGHTFSTYDLQHLKPQTDE